MTKKRPYSPPRITRVLLDTEESVLQSCKTDGISGPSLINSCGRVDNPCRALGT